MNYLRVSCLLLLLMSFSICQSQTTPIPDSVFEQLLIEAGLDAYPLDGEVATASIDTVTSLNLYTSGSTNVSDLSGIEDFAALTHLIVSFSDLTTLDLAQNLALQELHAYDNDIENLILPPSESLQYLELTGNPLGTLDVTQNPGLTYLSCSYGELDSLDLTNNAALVHLSCMINNLTELDISQNPNLSTMSCDNNAISELDLSNNPLLTSLSCSENNIAALDLSIHDSLAFILCRLNQLTALDISNNNALTYLDCSYNQITSLDASTHPLMIELFCQHNALSSLEVSAAVIGIDCDNNQLESLDVSGVENLVYSFNCSSNPMTCIQVSEAQLADIPANWMIDEDDNYALDCGTSAIGSMALPFDFNVYPNPTEGILNVTWPGSNAAEVLVVDMQGKVVKHLLNVQPGSTLNLGLPEAAYGVRVIPTNRSNDIPGMKTLYILRP